MKAPISIFLYVIGLFLYSINNYKLAYIFFNKSLEKKEMAKTCFKVGLSLLKLGEYEKAYSYIDEATTKAPRVKEWKNQLKQVNNHLDNRGPFIIPTSQDISNDNIRVVLYLSGPRGVGYQGNMWIKALENIDQKVAIVIREKWIARELHKTDIPIYYLPTHSDLEKLQIAGVCVVLYPGNPQKNAQMFRYIKIQHFFINHGDSDKVVNQSKLLRSYDKILVSGMAAEARLNNAHLNILPENIIHIGRPPAELSLNIGINSGPKAIKNILYAPTWEGFSRESNYSSIGEWGLSLLNVLSKLNDVKVFFKPHPYTGLTKSSDIEFYLGKMYDCCRKSDNISIIYDDDIYGYMNCSDLLITDISSVLVDYLYTRKPIILNISNLSDKVVGESEFNSRKACYGISSPEVQLLDIVKHISEKDSLQDERLDIADFYCGSVHYNALAKFNGIINLAVNENVG